jgi:hypothetical protein
MYRAKRGARNGIASVQKNAATAERFEKKTNKRGKAFFVLKAANHQVIGQSEAYESETACAAGIASVTQSAKAAGVTDLTA